MDLTGGDPPEADLERARVLQCRAIVNDGAGLADGRDERLGVGMLLPLPLLLPKSDAVSCGQDETGMGKAGPIALMGALGAWGPTRRGPALGRSPSAAAADSARCALLFGDRGW